MLFFICGVGLLLELFDLGLELSVFGFEPLLLLALGDDLRLGLASAVPHQLAHVILSLDGIAAIDLDHLALELVEALIGVSAIISGDRFVGMDGFVPQFPHEMQRIDYIMWQDIDEIRVIERLIRSAFLANLRSNSGSILIDKLDRRL